MKSLIKPLLIAAIVASGAIGATAQTTAPAKLAHAEGKGHHARMDPAKMQERMAARQAELKAKLNLNAAQQGAWNDYIAAMQPPADMMAKMSRENRQAMHQEMQALTTPERLDRMVAVKAQRDSHMAQRMRATRNFYDVLTTQQQKVFDANSMHGGHRGHGSHGGPAKGQA